MNQNTLHRNSLLQFCRQKEKNQKDTTVRTKINLKLSCVTINQIFRYN